MSENKRQENTAMVFDVQRYSLHDGPGIRTLVFLKGCPLRCWWCQNPEGQSLQQELAFNPERCISCLRCVATCPRKAVSVSWDGRPTIDRSICAACGQCVESCFAEALFMYGKRKSVGEVMNEIICDSVFYRNSGGGVTIGGGEPGLYPDFAVEVLRRSKDLGFHTAVETSGDVPWRDLKRILNCADMVLFDIKTGTPGAHLKYTGRPNRRIQENLRRSAEELPLEIIARIPVIPGVNTLAEEMDTIADFIASLKRIREAHLLPYHSVGESKYRWLGKLYRLSHLGAPSREELDTFAIILRERAGVEVDIGGLGRGRHSRMMRGEEQV